MGINGGLTKLLQLSYSFYKFIQMKSCIAVLFFWVCLIGIEFGYSTPIKKGYFYDLSWKDDSVPKTLSTYCKLEERNVASCFNPKEVVNLFGKTFCAQYVFDRKWGSLIRLQRIILSK